MAYSTFGTGMAAVTKGMSYTPDWNAESNKIIALTKNMQNFFKVKGEQAKEWAEMTVQAEGLGEADQLEYSEWLENDLFPQMSEFRKQNPYWRYVPEQHAKMSAMTKQIKNNDIVKRAANLKSEKEKFLKHVAEKDGYANTKAYRDLKEKLAYRESQGIYAYQEKYGEDDFRFEPTSMRNLGEAVTKYLAKHVQTKMKVKREGGLKLAVEVTEPTEITNDEVIDFWTQMEPEMNEYLASIKSVIGDNKLEQDSVYVRRFMENYLAQIKENIKHVRSDVQDFQAYQTGLYYKRRGLESKYKSNPFLTDLRLGNGKFIRTKYMLGSVPTEPIRDSDGKYTNKNLFNGSNIVVNGVGKTSGGISTLDVLESLGIKVIVPMGNSTAEGIYNETTGLMDTHFKGTLYYETPYLVDEEDNSFDYYKERINRVMEEYPDLMWMPPFRSLR